MNLRTAIIAAQLVFLATVAAAQFEIRVISSCEMERNTVYVGVENYLHVKGLLPTDRLRSNGNIFYRRDSLYLYTPRPNGKTVTNVDSILVMRNNRVVALFLLKRMKICDPEATLQNAVDGYATVAGLLAYPKITITFPGCCLDPRHFNAHVVAFNMAIFKAKQQEVQTTGVGPSFTEEQKQIIRTLKPGDKIWLSNVRAVGTHLCTRIMGEVNVTIR